MGTPFDRDETMPGRLARIHVDTGVVDRFELPEQLQIGSNPHSLTAGPDDNIWVGLRGADQIARFNLSTLTWDKFVDFTAAEQTGPNDIKYSRFDGRFYVAMQESLEIASFAYDPVTDSVSDLQRVPVLEDATKGITIAAVVVGPEGKIWFTGSLEQPLPGSDDDGIPDETPQDLIGRFDPVTGEIDRFSHGLMSSQDPIEIIVGPDNNLWFNLTNPGFLPPPNISPLPGAFGRLVPSQAEAHANTPEGIAGNVLFSRLVLDSPFPGTRRCQTPKFL